MRPAPLLEQPAPLFPLAPEPVSWLQVLDPLRQLALGDPALQVLAARVDRLPRRPDLVEALLLGWDREAAKGLRKVLLQNVLHDWRSEPLLLLALGQFGSVRRLFRGLLNVLLLLLLLLAILLVPVVGTILHPRLAVAVLRVVAVPLVRGAPPPVRGAPTPGLLRGPLPPLLEELRAHRSLEVFGRLAHDNHGHSLEVRLVEGLEHLRALGRHQVAADLHDHVVALDHRSHGVDHLPDRVIVQLPDAEAHVGPVVAGARGAALAPEAALRAPFQDHAAAELEVVRVRLEEPVQPLERPLVGQAHGEHDLTL
mmetsp:Transcript_110183/g.311550  ORF Transcript_110183/g.311550 Transcript_110183/m.311550 type:complete len:311 (+) Transcript_110183:1142-2074(+)